MRSLWGYGALFIASLGAIDLLLAPTVGTVVGLLLLAFMGYALAWFHPRLAGSRFPIRVGVVVSVIGVATWLVSLLARIEVTTGPNQAWVLGYGQVEQTTYCIAARALALPQLRGCRLGGNRSLFLSDARALAWGMPVRSPRGYCLGPPRFRRCSCCNGTDGFQSATAAAAATTWPATSAAFAPNAARRSRPPRS